MKFKLNTKGLEKNNTGTAIDPDKKYSLKLSQMRSDKKNPTKPKSVKKKRSYKLLKNILISLTIIFFLVLGIGSVLAYQFIVIPAMAIRDSLKVIQESASLIANDLGQKNIGNLQREVKSIRGEFTNIINEVEKYEFLNDLELTRGYYKNLQVVKELVEKTDLIVESYLPRMEVLLRATGFVSFPYEPGTLPVIPVIEDEESALTLIMSELPEYIALYKEIEPSIIDLFQTVKKIDTNYVPVIQDIDIRDDLNEFNSFADEYPVVASQVLDFISAFPGLIGSERPTTFLLYLHNEAEMRSAGGLLSAFGHMTIDKGEIKDLKLSDSWEVETFVSSVYGVVDYNIYGQDVLMNRGCGASALRFQDAGIYPDLNWTMNKYTEYYDIARRYNPNQYPAYDNMLVINFAFAQNLLSYLQPLTVEGYGEVNADVLFDFIKTESDSVENRGSFDRKDIIEKIADAIKKKLFELDISEMDAVFKLILNSFYARDIALASKNADMQSFFDKYSLSGRIDTTFADDYVHINEAQNCALKLNKFLRNSVDHITNINPDGTIDRNVTVNWEQPVVFRPELYLQYSPTLNFSYRAWVRVVTTPGISNFISDGRAKSGYLFYTPKTYFDNVFNRSVSDNIIQFDHRRFSDAEAIPRHSLSVGYRLPNEQNFNSKGYYRLLLQKHSGKSNWEKHKLTINYNGGVYTVETTLDRDKVITFKDGEFTVENYDTKLDWLVDLIDRIPFDDLAD